jgi:hypothetical protein
VQLLICWVLFPLVAVAVAAGVGLLVELAAGRRLPGALLLPVGLAGAFALTQVTTSFSWLAPATVPVLVLAAVAGLVAGRRSLRARRADPWAAVAALGVFAVFAAPVVFSGQPSFAGYTMLGDTSIHLIGADALLEHGRDFSALPPSSYQAALNAYYGSAGYPSGGPVVVGALSRLVGQDPAWTFQPFLALLAAMLALSLYALIGRLVRPRPWRAGIAFLAAQPALVLSYALQGSIKEIATAYAVTTLAALVPEWVAARDAGPRGAITLTVVAAAAVAVVGPAAGVWVAPLLLVGLVAALRVWGRASWRALAGAVAVFAALGLVLTWQSLESLRTYVAVAGTVVTNQVEVGNLFGPLKVSQALGIWLNGDYRLPPASLFDDTFVFIGVAVVGAILGLALVIRRRALGVALYVGVSLLAWAYVTAKGSPWADGKALMIVSPAVLLVVALGARALAESGRRIEGAILAALIGLGVLGSNALAYHDVSLAPHDRLAELGGVGERLAGRGPVVYPEFEEFGKHFLRQAEPEGVTEAWHSRPVQSSSSPAGGPRFAVSADVDQIAHPYLAEFRAIVLRRGFGMSRPPSDFRLTWRGRWYEIWQRDPAGPRVLEHLPLGAPRTPAAVPRCGELKAMATRAAQAGGRLALAPRAPAPMFAPALAPHSPSWAPDPGDPAGLVPVGPGRVQGYISVPRAGRYDVWLDGSFARAVDIAVGGRRVGSVAYAINARGDAELAGTVQLGSGRNTVTLTRGGGDLRPGNGGARRIGPLALTPAGEPAPVQTVAPADWRSWCGRSLDWAEIVGSGA